MTLQNPLWMKNLTYAAVQDREFIDSAFPTAGVVTSGDLTVSQHAAGSNMSVDVSTGSVVVVGTAISGQGKYVCKSDAVTNVTIATAPASGHSRIDLIVAQVQDADADGGTNNDWIITAVTGTSATTGSQVAPSAPASSYVLAHVAVGPSVTGILTANISNLSSPIRSDPQAFTLGSNYTVTGTPTTLLSTGVLDVGTWEIDFSGLASVSPASSFAEAIITIVDGSATATFTGKYTGQLYLSSSSDASLSIASEINLKCLAVVTVAGTLNFQAFGVGSADIQATALSSGTAGVTGGTAVRKK